MMVVNELAVEYARENERLRARVAELEAQLSALQPAWLDVGGWSIDLRSGKYARGGVEAGHLTRTELDLMKQLAKGPASYAQLIAAAWPGADADSSHSQQTVRMNIFRIRLKLGDVIKVVRGVGYSLA